MPTPQIHADRAAKQKAYRDRQKAAIAEQLAAKNLPTVSIIPTMPSAARWKALHEQARRALQTMLDEMQAYRDERTDTWQESERGEAFTAMIDQAQEMIDTVEEFTPRPET